MEIPLRLLLVNHSSRRIAGTEIYLEDLIRELESRSVPVALLAENDTPVDRPQIAHAADSPVFRSMEDALAWEPSCVMVNGRIRPDWESGMSERLPSVYFIHNYHGTCISGLKRHLYPKPEPCERVFGLGCLALYLPKHCGGRNPATMFRLFTQERAHQRRLQGYRCWLTHSTAMRSEYLRHGFPPEAVRVLPFACISRTDLQPMETCALLTAPEPGEAWRVLFAGRMESVKGGAELLRAAAAWCASSGPVELTMAGDGEQRAKWEALARSLQDSNPRFRAVFPGWLLKDRLQKAYASHHLFAMPSLWPEPFGKGGIEAGCFGCPSVGFATGGIPEWLHEGENGHLADWRGDAGLNLENALRACTASPDHYLSLRHGARRVAEVFTVQAHCDRLLPLLLRVSEGGVL